MRRAGQVIGAVLGAGLLLLVVAGCGDEDDASEPVVVEGSSEGDAWIASPVSGDLVRLDARTGEPVERTPVAADGETIVVASDGRATAYFNRTGGEVGVLGGSSVTGQRDTDVRSSGRLLVGGGDPYLVDEEDGIVQRIDPVTAADAGTAEVGPGPIGGGAVDADGRLWLLEPTSGDLVALEGEAEVERRSLALVGPGVVTATAQGPVVLDARAGVLFDVEGVRRAVPMGSLSGYTTMAPDLSSDLLWAASSERLLGIDPATAEVVHDVELPEGSRGAPLASDGVVYVPGPAADEVTIVDPDGGEPTVVEVGAEQFELVAIGAGAVVNDRSSPLVGVVAPDGGYQEFEKYEPRTVRTTTSTTAPPPPTTVTPGGGSGGGGSGGGGGGGTPTTSPPQTTPPTTSPPPPPPPPTTVCLSDC